MTDREKVIERLEYCAETRDVYVRDCINDALALLKEQEPKPVGKEWNECPSCGKVLDRIHDMHYCGVCGQAVKWDG